MSKMEWTTTKQLGKMADVAVLGPTHIPDHCESRGYLLGQPPYVGSIRMRDFAGGEFVTRKRTGWEPTPLMRWFS